jgi:hypothetical protein
MHGLKTVSVCVLIVAIGNVFVAVRAQAPEATEISNTAPVSEQADNEKSLLAPSLQTEMPDAASAELCQCVDQRESAATKRIEQALNGPLHSTGIEVADMPLEQVVMKIRDDYLIPVQIDGRALEEAGVGRDAPVSKNIRNISLRSGLKLMLEDLDLTWIIRDEVLMITTKEVANRHLVTCVYNVEGLVDEKDSMDGLIDAISSCVASDSWAENGGTQADMRPIMPGLLVVSQTPAIHEEVKSLLAKIRKAREQVPIKVRPRSAGRTPGQSTVAAPAKREQADSHGDEIEDSNPFR